MATDRQLLVIQAKFCESANRYDDMVDVVRELVTTLPKKENLTPEQRQLLAVAYKFEVGARRRSLRAIHKLLNSGGLNAKNKLIVIDYKKEITHELQDLCSDLLSMLDSFLLPIVDEEESDIFYHKLKGDYCRYLAEVEEDPDKATELVNTAKENYDGATEYAQQGLAATHPLRIGLAMNYSVFIHEMLDNTSQAHAHARRFYDEALDELEGVREVDETRYNECARLLSLMHENIKLWEPHARTTAEPIPETQSKQP